MHVVIMKSYIVTLIVLIASVSVDCNIVHYSPNTVQQCNGDTCSSNIRACSDTSITLSCTSDNSAHKFSWSNGYDDFKLDPKSTDRSYSIKSYNNTSVLSLYTVFDTVYRCKEYTSETFFEHDIHVFNISNGIDCSVLSWILNKLSTDIGLAYVTLITIGGMYIMLICILIVVCRIPNKNRRFI